MLQLSSQTSTHKKNCEIQIAPTETGNQHIFLLHSLYQKMLLKRAKQARGMLACQFSDISWIGPLSFVSCQTEEEDASPTRRAAASQSTGFLDELLYCCGSGITKFNIRICNIGIILLISIDSLII